MLEPGTQIGRYEIQRRLGRGGMGAVYVAHDPVLGRMVAIKVFAGDLDIPDARERFTREARSAAALNHPNIVTVYDFGEYSSQPFIVMEYVPGETLAAMIRRKASASTGDKLRWIEELCAGAGYAHRMSVIHRDIKPANLMIDRSGRLKILDFGIARMMGTASNTMAMIGTPGYMSPEQIQGDPVDHRSDLFSIGVVLYELLSYAEAFPGDTMPTIVHRVLSDAPPSLAGLVPDLGPDVVAIVDRLLEKKPADRFEDAEAVRAAIGRVRQARDSDSSFVGAPATIARRDVPPAGGGSRGTGSARRGSSDAIGVAQLTPPPDPRRADREALARRRTDQLNASLEQARARLGVGDLEGAYEACQQALTFDENHADALALEEAIAAALAARSGAPTVDPAAPPTDMAPSPPTAPEAAAFERTMLTPPPGPAIADLDALIEDAQRGATVLAPGRGTPAPARGRTPPPAVTPAPIPAAVAAAPAAAGVPGSVRAASPAAPTVPPTAKMPKVRVPPAAAQKQKQPGPGLAHALKSRAASVQAAVAAQPKQAKVVAAGTAAVVVVAAIVGALLLPAGPVPTGTLVIDAAPWGSIQSIESEDGVRQPLPTPASTPLSLPLPIGSYQVVVAGPTGDTQTQRFGVEITEGAATVAPFVRFRAITPEEYFEEYLAVSAPADAASDAGAPAATAPAPAPSGVAQ